MDIFAAIFFLLGAVGAISIFAFLARAVRKRSENEIKYKLVYEMMVILVVIVLLLISLLVVPAQTVKIAIIALLYISILAVPINLVFGLQRYLFNRYKKKWHLIVLTITQFICFAVPVYWFYQFEKGVEEDPGIAYFMVASTLTVTMMIIWVINCITAGIAYFRLRN
jgi:peptidoglycan/LPS O-acetylase OafA/YrhL